MKKLALLVLAALPAFLHAQTDDFNDGTADGWTPYNPIGVGSFNVVNQAYRIQAAPTGTPANPGRSGALRTEVNYTDFYICVDIVSWNTNLNQSIGILARLTDIGPGRSDGYALTLHTGGRDLDISVFTNEVPADVPGQAGGGFNLVPGKSYRLAFSGKGTRLTGEVYDLTNLDTPLVSIAGDSDSWASGVAGLLTYDPSSGGNNGADATFDNYFALPFQPPRLKIQALDFGDMLISWPTEPTNYVLQATSTLGVNWTDITENIGEDPGSGRRFYTDNLFLQELRFYRLRP